MNPTLLIFTIILFLAAAISVGLIIFAWRRRATAGALSFTMLMLSLSIWLIGYMVEISRYNLTSRTFWVNVEYIGIVTIPVAWFVFAMDYTGRTNWLSRRNIAALLVEPLIITILIWTNGAHGLFRKPIAFDTTGSIPYWEVDYGTLFWVHTAYSYLFMLLGILIFAIAFVRSSKVFRRQVGIILVGATGPWLVNILYVFDLVPPYVDPTPFGFLFSGMLTTWGVFGFRLIKTMPIARNAVIENMSDGMLVIDAQNHVVDLNPAAAQIIDRQAKDVIGEPAIEVLSAWPDIVERYQDVTNTNENIVLRNGEAEHWYALHISPLVDDKDRLTGRIIVLRNITEQKRTEEAYLTLVRQSLQGLAIFQNEHVVFANPALAEITGFTTHELTSFPTEKFFTFIHPDDHDVVVNTTSVPSLKESGFVRNEFRFIDKNGTMRWFEQISSAIQYRGRPAVQTAMIDISERKEAEHVLRAARDVAEQANRAKSTFLANMSHELRTPLAAIIGYSEMMREQADTQNFNKFTTRLVNIEAAANHLLVIINDILDLSKIEAGKMEIQSERFDVQALVENVLVTTQPLLEKNNNLLQVEYGREIGRMVADQTKVRQVLLNLVGNANKFTEDGHVTIRVLREAAANGLAENENIVFEISDTGIGMTEKQIESLFQPFEQADASPSRRYGGTGLGLAISLHYCQMMNGSLNVKSEEGVGSTFTVCLPAYDNEQRLLVTAETESLWRE